MSEQPHPEDQESGNLETANQDDTVSGAADSGAEQAAGEEGIHASTDLTLEQALVKLAGKIDRHVLRNRRKGPNESQRALGEKD